MWNPDYNLDVEPVQIQNSIKKFDHIKLEIVVEVSLNKDTSKDNRERFNELRKLK